MKLTLTLPRSSFRFQEAIPAHFSLSELAVGLRLPLDFAERIWLRVRTEEGQTLTPGSSPSLLPEDSAEAGTLAAGAQPTWTADLLAAFGALPVGRHEVQAGLLYAVGGVDLATPWLPFEVEENPCRYLTTQGDKITLELQYVLQLSAVAQASALCHILAPGEATRIWFGGTAAVPPHARPVFSEGDFRTHATFDHDFTRWLGWVEGDKLMLLRLVTASQAGPAHELPLAGDASPEIVGPPLQHRGGGLSIHLLSRHLQAGESRGGYVLTRETLSADFDERATSIVARFPEKPAWLSAAPDQRGNTIFVADAPSPGRFRCLVWPHGDWWVPDTRTWQRLDDGESPRLLRVRLAAKPASPEGVGVLALAIAEDRDGAFVVLARTPHSEGASTPVVIRIALSDDLLGVGESFNGGDVAQTAPGRLHGLLFTSRGRIFAVAEGSTPRFIAEVPPADLDGVSLITTPYHAVHVLYPTAREGFGNITLVPPSLM